MNNRVEQALNRAWARLVPGATAYCAVSGGLDSMVLLELMAKAWKAEGSRLGLVALHVNHNLRGSESDGDESFVRAAAKRLGIPFQVLRLEWGSEKSSQALCREKREAFFRSCLKSAGDRIFLAHHLNDQAETLMLRLLRGSGLRGLGGMRLDAGGKLRPFLKVSRAEIEAYARAKKISWREDSSNKSAKYERNWLRLEILPKLEARRPGFAEKLAALAEEAAMLEYPAGDFPYFELNEDWAFYRGHDLKAASSGELSAALRLSRLHTRGLMELLQKGSGRYSAEGVGFRFSAGILLAEKKPFVAASDWEKRAKFVAVQNLLGRWEIPLQPGERVGVSSELALGDKAKKEFQKYRVPVFFRELIPFVVKDGRPSALLPISAKARAQIELGALGKWWLES